MATKAVNIGINLKDGFTSPAKGISKQMQAMGTGIQKGINGIDSMFKGLTGTLAGLGATVGAMALLKGASAMQERLERIGIAAGATTKDMEGLYQSIAKISSSKGINVKADETLQAVESIMEKTGNIEYATANIANMATVIGATGAAGAEVGAIFSDLDEKMKLKSPAEIAEALDILIKQGKAGSLTFQNMASLGNRLFSAYAATGHKGAQGVKEMGAVMQVYRSSTGSAEMATTAFEATLSELSDPKKQQALKDMGVNVKDAAGNWRALPDILTDIGDKFGSIKGGDEALAEIFGQQSIRGVKAMVVARRELGATYKTDNRMASFMRITGDGSEAMQDAARMSETLAGSLRGLSNAWDAFAQANLAAPVRTLAKALNSLSFGGMQTLLGIATKIGLAFAGVVVSIKAVRGVMGVFRGISSIFKKPGASAGGLGGMAGATPVFVTNMPGGGLGGAMAGGINASAITRIAATAVAGLGVGAIIGIVLASLAVMGGVAYIASITMPEKTQSRNAYNERRTAGMSKAEAIKLGQQEAAADPTSFYGNIGKLGLPSTKGTIVPTTAQPTTPTTVNVNITAEKGLNIKHTAGVQ